jgi:H+/Cl- antiporter ClcA
MPMASNSEALSSLVLSIAVGGIALVLGLHQWSQWRGRDADLVQAERVYFFRQDLRRAVGVLFMVMIAVGIFVGSRVPPLIADADVKQALGVIAGPWVEFPISTHANPQFLTIWLAVIVLLVILLGLALFDWLATRRYAHRQRQSMARERLEILRTTFRRADTDRNGSPPGPGTTSFPS